MESPRESTGRAGPLSSGILLATICSAILLVHASAISFLNDDAFISFRYAKNWAAGSGLVFNPGERVEGYTNFLWTVAIGVLAKAGADPIPASRVLGYLAAAGALFATARLSRRLAPGPSPARGLALLLLAASSPFAYWALAGLEGPLFALFLVLAVERQAASMEREGVARARAAAVAGLLLGLAALTRPEGAFLFALVFAFRFLAPGARGLGSRLARELPFAAPFLLVYAPYFLWRYSYYGFLFPNTFYVRRGSGFAENLDLYKAGAAYVLGLLRDCGGPLLATPLLLVARRGPARVTSLLALLVVSWIAYLVYVGGDAKILCRFAVPILPLLYLLVEAAVGEIAAALGRRTSPEGEATPHFSPRALRAVGILSAVACAAAVAAPSFAPPEKYRIDRTVFALMAEGGKWFARHAPPGSTVACFAVGALPYHAGLPTYDLLGVTDAVIAHGPLRKGQMAGHGKTDWDYILAKKPTYIVPMESPDLGPAGYDYAPISLEVEGQVLQLRTWKRRGG